MFGLDERLAAASDGAPIWIVLAVAVLLGLRHATDPDHLVAVTTLVAGGRERAARRSGELGLAWGLGHAATLFAFGLPILLLGSALPERVQQGAETAIGLVIVYLALRLLVRWRGGELRFHADPHAHPLTSRSTSPRNFGRTRRRPGVFYDLDWAGYRLIPKRPGETRGSLCVSRSRCACSLASLLLARAGSRSR